MSDEVAEKHKKPMWAQAAAFSQRTAEKVRIEGGLIGGQASSLAGGSEPFTAIRAGFGVDVVRLGLRVDALKFYVDDDQPGYLFDGEFTILVEKPWQIT